MDGIQPWSQGEFPGWTFPIVQNEGTGLGHIRGLHISGLTTPKFGFRIGDRATFDHAHGLCELHAGHYTEEYLV